MSSVIHATWDKFPKIVSSFLLENITSYSYTKWHYSESESTILCTKCREIGRLFILFIKSVVVIMHASANRCAMSSGVLENHGSWITATLRFFRSMQILGFSLPSLSLPSTITYLSRCSLMYRFQVTCL